MLNDYVFECDGINDCEDGNDELDCCKFGNYVSAWYSYILTIMYVQKYILIW